MGEAGKAKEGGFADAALLRQHNAGTRVQGGRALGARGRRFAAQGQSLFLFFVDTLRVSLCFCSSDALAQPNPAQPPHAFVRISTASGRSLTVSARHYVHVNGSLAQAGRAKAGDTLRLSDGSATRVTDVRNVQAEGLYSPYTLQGDIVVDGVQASCYSADAHPAVVHALTWPLRAFHRAFGFSLLTKAPEAAAVGDVFYALVPRGQS